MANLTIAVDDGLLRRARVRAAERGTSVNAVLREHLAGWVGSGEERARAVASLLERSKKARSRRGSARWTRDELHER
jgi:plasmid stability protein